MSNPEKAHWCRTCYGTGFIHISQEYLKKCDWCKGSGFREEKIMRTFSFTTKVEDE